MYKSLAILFLSAVLFSFKGANNAPTVYKVTTGNSLMVWYCQENMEVHSGSLMFSNGSFNVSDNKVTGGSFELDMSTLIDNDLKGEAQKTLLERLVSKDLFNTLEFPAAKFVITKSELLKPDQYLMEGNMTIKGQTRVIRIPMVIVLKDQELQAMSSDVLIEGAAFGLKTGPASDGSGSELKNFKFKISQLYAKKG